MEQQISILYNKAKQYLQVFTCSNKQHSKKGGGDLSHFVLWKVLTENLT